MNNAERAVERLTQHHTEIENGHPVEWPPLLDWLERSITEVTGRSGGSGEGGSPFNENAWRLQQRITRRLRLIHEALFIAWDPSNLTAATELAWATTQAERNGGRMDDSQWESISDEFIDWVQRIEAEDNRPMSLPLEQCPRCGARRVYATRDEDGERAYVTDAPSENDSPRPAITVEWDEGRLPVAECRNPDCDGHWVGWEAIAGLGYTLGATQDLAVLEACGISLNLMPAT